MSDTSSPQVSAAYFIKYNPQLSRYFGSQNATILFDRLEYWFSKKQSQFYKFIEPCDHPLCKEGDTWSEELGFSKKVFRTAFDKIGVRYRSKTEFEKEEDPFKGKFFAYYQDRQTKKTIFVRNDQIVSDLYKKLKSLLSEKPKLIKKEDKKDNRAEAFKSVTSSKGSPTADPLGSPHVRANIDKQINTSYSNMKMNLDSVCNESNSAIIDSKTNEMLEIWKNIIGDMSIPNLSSLSRAKLYERYLKIFKGSIEKWTDHCQKIGSSKFLMGEKGRSGKSYKLNFWVATSESFKDQLDNEVFELNTRQNALYDSYKRTRSLAEAKQKANQDEGVVQAIRNYLIENYFTAYQACFSAAEIQEEEGGVVSIICKTSWAKDYIKDNLTCVIQSMQDAFNTNVEIA